MPDPILNSTAGRPQGARPGYVRAIPEGESVGERAARAVRKLSASNGRLDVLTNDEALALSALILARLDCDGAA